MIYRYLLYRSLLYYKSIPTRPLSKPQSICKHLVALEGVPTIPHLYKTEKLQCGATYIYECDLLVDRLAH